LTAVAGMPAPRVQPAPAGTDATVTSTFVLSAETASVIVPPPPTLPV
jgi:hypothetical protein